MDRTDDTDALLDLAYPDWVARMEEIGTEAGFFESLGADHHAHFTEEDGGTLLVSFETFAAINATSEDGMPLGTEVAADNGWSHLAVVSRNDTWFREETVYEFFDQLNDDGFFDDFDNILFYGAGSCGYAACAFSVAAPGARVLALHPQATLETRLTEWDERFVWMRRTSFSDRYGYAPDMIDAADAAWILYDPREPLDAMHASLFARSNATLLRMRSMGGALQADLAALDLLEPILVGAMDGSLDLESFARMMRARRGYGTYLRRLLARLESEDRTALVRMLCRNVTGRMRAPRFGRRLRAIEAAEAAKGEQRAAQSA